MLAKKEVNQARQDAFKQRKQDKQFALLERKQDMFLLQQENRLTEILKRNNDLERENDELSRNLRDTEKDNSYVEEDDDGVSTDRWGGNQKQEEKKLEKALVKIPLRKSGRESTPTNFFNPNSVPGFSDTLLVNRKM